MPLRIRRLPGKTVKLFDKNKLNLPNNNLFFNPSISYPIIYIRGSRFDKYNTHENFILLSDIKNSKLYIIDSPNDLLENNVNFYRGIEDLRIIHWKDKLWFTATSTHSSKKMNNELILGNFDDKFSRIERLNNVDINSLPVKNVCPFVHNDKLLLLDIYLKCIYEITEEKSEDSRKPNFVATKKISLEGGSGINFNEFRGSTSPVHLFGNTWGCIIHDIIFNDTLKLETRLSYIHHWMEFNIETGIVTFISTPFWVAHWGIEYVSGLNYDMENNLMQLYIGIHDSDCVMTETTLYDLRVGK
jgi:hypothetical protein